MKKLFTFLFITLLLMTACATGDVEELKIEDLALGDGDAATDGDVLEVHYVGTLENGEKFDSSRDRDATFSFTLGAGQVIQGWDEGMKGMKVGGMRMLTIPPEMGYGDRSAGSIPPGSTLIFEVELIGIE